MSNFIVLILIAMIIVTVLTGCDADADEPSDSIIEQPSEIVTRSTKNGAKRL